LRIACGRVSSFVTAVVVFVTVSSTCRTGLPAAGAGRSVGSSAAGSWVPPVPLPLSPAADVCFVGPVTDRV
jgi:hypothetical protein